MSNSIGTLSRRLCRSLISTPKTCHHLSRPLCTNHVSSRDKDSDADEFAHNSDEFTPKSDEFAPNSDIDAVLDSGPTHFSSESSSSNSNNQRVFYDRPLENGLDAGIYKAILVGQVGQPPLQKKLRSGKVVTLMSLGTGGIRNNRRPLDNENPSEYANRCAVQWHRVSVYSERLGNVVMKHVVPSSIIYVEGNLETKIFTDPITGLVRRIREVAIRRHGRLVFLGQGGDAGQQTQINDFKKVGYY